MGSQQRPTLWWWWRFFGANRLLGVLAPESSSWASAPLLRCEATFVHCHAFSRFPAQRPECFLPNHSLDSIRLLSTISKCFSSYVPCRFKFCTKLYNRAVSASPSLYTWMNSSTVFNFVRWCKSSSVSRCSSIRWARFSNVTFLLAMLHLRSKIFIQSTIK